MGGMNTHDFPTWLAGITLRQLVEQIQKAEQAFGRDSSTALILRRELDRRERLLSAHTACSAKGGTRA